MTVASPDWLILFSHQGMPSHGTDSVQCRVLPRIQYLTFRGAHFEMLNETRKCVRNDSNTAPKNNRNC